jgi:hypothetical protein
VLVQGLTFELCGYPGARTCRIWLASPFDMMKKFKKKKSVRALKLALVFRGLAFTSPAKTVTSLLTLPSVLWAGFYFKFLSSECKDRFQFITEY